jgi:histidyl-tRNA synthetase
VRAPRGTFDVLGEDAQARAALEQTSKQLLERAGYERIETPTFEHTELFARGVGEATDVVQKEMFSFEAGGRSMTLRPEGTAPVARAYMEHGMHKRPQPVKLWYLGPFFRHETPQAGRYWQFTQLGIENIGVTDPAADAECIVLLQEVLEAVGSRGLRLRLSSLGNPETRAEYREELQGFLQKLDLPPDKRERIAMNPLRAFDWAEIRSEMRDAPLLIDRLQPEDREHFEAVKEMLDAVGVPYEVDPTLVRGLDYYTRTVWEFTSDALGAQSGVGGGGRYDRLIETLGGQPTPGVGWAAGVERMLLSSQAPPTAPPPMDLFVAYAKPELRTQAFRLAADARRAGHAAKVELGGRGLKGQMKQANNAHARWVAILGDEGISLKDMESGEQRVVEPDTVMHHIRQGII